MMRSSTLKVLLLALLFVCPSVAAYLLYTHPHWAIFKTTNKGALITPPLAIEDLTNKSWGLILWNPQTCEKACTLQLDKLARIRLALGRHLYNVKQYLFVPDNDDLPKDLLEALKNQDIFVKKISANALEKMHLSKDEQQIFISSPENYLILRYSSQEVPANIFTDIKHLLNKNG